MHFNHYSLLELKHIYSADIVRICLQKLAAVQSRTITSELTKSLHFNSLAWLLASC